MRIRHSPGSTMESLTLLKINYVKTKAKEMMNENSNDQ